jgi:hypothetical protein
MPAYMELFDPNANLSDNIRNVLMQSNSYLQSDALLVLHEQFDEPRSYISILQAVAQNQRTRKDIADFTGLLPDTVSNYLNTLVALNFVERRLPVTSKPTADVRKGRYYLQDPYLRFYFRFIAPNLDDIENYRIEKPLNYIRQNLRAFVGEHAFEYLSRDWVSFVANQGRLPCFIDRVGGYWGRDAQLDVFAVNDDERIALIGECKWGADRIETEVIEKLRKQAPKGVAHLPEPEKWKTYLYLFVRAGLTHEAEQLARQHNVQIITLEQLDKDLREDI